MNKVLKILFFLVLLIPSVGTYAQLSDDEKDFLANRVKDNYEGFGIIGTQVYKTSKHWTLVAITESSGLGTLNARQAQISATRSVKEFLVGAVNTSTTIYNASSKEKNGELNEESSLSDIIVQEAKDVLNSKGLQTLMSFKNSEGKRVYVYYLVLSKKNAKRKI